MEPAAVDFLSLLSAKVFWFAATAFVVVNGTAIAILLLTRSRRLVNDWTGRLVALDAVLIGAGLGVPLVAGLAKIGIHALAAMFGGGSTPAR